MAVILRHTFTAPNSTTTIPPADTGQTGIALRGTWGIRNNEAYNASGGNDALYVFDVGTPNGQIDVTLLNDVNENHIAFRVASNTSYTLFTRRVDTLAFWRNNNGAWTNVGQTTISNPITAPEKVSVRMNGDSIQCLINDVVRISYTDTFNNTATMHGLGSNTSNPRFDDITFDNLQTAGGTTYTQTVGQASVTPSGAITMRLTLSKTVGQATMTPSGSLSQVLGTGLSVGGAILQPIGSLVKRTYKGVGGVVTSAGNAAKGMFKTVGNGSISPTGAVSSQLNPEPPTSAGRTVINWVMKGLKNFFD